MDAPYECVNVGISYDALEGNWLVWTVQKAVNTLIFYTKGNRFSHDHAILFIHTHTHTSYTTLMFVL